MKKTLLSLFAFALALGVNAQKVLPFSGSLERSTVKSQAKAMLKSAPKKAELADNQRYVGGYYSDDLGDNGVGIPYYTSGSCRAATMFTTDNVLADYVGMKVVGMRFGLCYSVGSTSAFLMSSTSSGLSEITSQEVSSTAVGWNEVKFDTPYTIQSGDELLVGYNYTQKQTNNGYTYNAECYPISVADNDLYTPTYLYIYCNIPKSYGGSGQGWYNFGLSNMSVQLIVEGDHKTYNVSPFSIAEVSAKKGETAVATVNYLNLSKETATSLQYICKVDGNSSEAQTVSSSVAKNGYGSFNIAISNLEAGMHSVEVEIQKVNGQDNQASATKASGEVGIYTKGYPKNVLAEEFTTEKCPNCPRVAGFFKTALSTADLTRVFPVCHHAGYYTDWLTANWDTDIMELMFNGSEYAPAMTFNRDYELVKEGASLSGVMMIPTSAAEITAYINAATEQDAKVGLTMTAARYTDNSKAFVTVEGECNEALSNTDKELSKITFYLTEDEIKAKSQSGASGTYYHEHVVRANNTPWGENVVWDGNKFTATYDVDIKTAWNVDNLKLVAVLNRYDESFDDGWKTYKKLGVINVTGMNFTDATTTGINGVVDSSDSVEAARYSLDGVRLSAPQKGLNIVKLSNGKTMKVMVK